MKKAITFYYEEDSCELDRVVESKTFSNETPLGRADVLQDIQGWVEEALETAREQVAQELAMLSPTKGQPS